MAKFDPRRGEIWNVRYKSARGQEIRKARPSLVINAPKAGRKEMRIIVPITTGQEKYVNLAWMVRILADSANGLDNDSFADASQVQPASLKRFVDRKGLLQSQSVLDNISEAVALCVGYDPSRRKRRRK